MPVLTWMCLWALPFQPHVGHFPKCKLFDSRICQQTDWVVGVNKFFLGECKLENGIRKLVELASRTTVKIHSSGYLGLLEVALPLASGLGRSLAQPGWVHYQGNLVCRGLATDVDLIFYLWPPLASE